MSRSRYRFFLIAVPLVVALALPGAAEATFPGENGKIAFSGCSPGACGVVAVNADGSERTQITHNPFSAHRSVTGSAASRIPGQDAPPALVGGRPAPGLLPRGRHLQGSCGRRWPHPADHDARARIRRRMVAGRQQDRVYALTSRGRRAAVRHELRRNPGDAARGCRRHSGLVAGRQQDRLRGCTPEPQRPSLQLLP